MVWHHGVASSRGVASKRGIMVWHQGGASPQAVRTNPGPWHQGLALIRFVLGRVWREGLGDLVQYSRERVLAPIYVYLQRSWMHAPGLHKTSHNPAQSSPSRRSGTTCGPYRFCQALSRTTISANLSAAQPSPAQPSSVHLSTCLPGSVTLSPALFSAARLGPGQCRSAWLSPALSGSAQLRPAHNPALSR